MVSSVRVSILLSSSVYRRRTGTASPSSSALAKLAGMMTLAILRGAAVLAEADIAISQESGNSQAFFNISSTMVPGVEIESRHPARGWGGTVIGDYLMTTNS